MTTRGSSPAMDEIGETRGVVHRGRSRCGTKSTTAVWPREPTAPRTVATSTPTRISERRAPSDDVPVQARGVVMEKLLERCAALDVHKRQVTACADVPDRKGERAELRAEFETRTPVRLERGEWHKGVGAP